MPAPPGPLPQAGGFAERRALVCAYLGVGNSDGKQLLRQLNAYGFLREDLAEALAWVQRQLQAVQQQRREAEEGEAQGAGPGRPARS